MSRRTRRRGAPWRPAAALLLACAIGGAARAQISAESAADDRAQIAAFRITSIEGMAGTRYWRDTNDVTSRIASFGAEGPEAGESVRNRQQLSSLRTELFVLARGYAYHPKLAALEMGFGPVYDIDGFSNDGASTTTRDTNYNLVLRGRFLAEKPYRGEAFYERTHDSQPVGPAQSLLLQNIRYGGSVSVTAPATPVPVTVSGNRFEIQGSGTEQVIDDRIDELNVKAEREMPGRGDVRFHYQATRTQSMSGSLGVAIHPSRTDADRLQLDSHLTFGATGQYDLYGLLTLNKLSTSSEGVEFDNRQWRAMFDVRGRHGETLRSYAQYQYDDNRQNAEAGAQDSRVHSANAGLTYQPTEATSATVDGNVVVTRGTALSSTQEGIGGSVGHRFALWVGEVSVNGRTGYRHRDQSTEQSLAHVLGERVTLADSVFRALANPQVVATSIVVMNVQRSQTYSQGIDYELDLLGLATRIRRIVGGSIVDGQEVLVDYSYDVGGTYATGQVDSALDLGWRISNVYSIYARYYDTSIRLLSGTPTTPINPGHTLVAGTRADVPLPFVIDTTLGGLLEWEDRQEEVAPYRRTTAEAYADVAVPWIPRSGVHVGARRQKLEYPLTPIHDVTQMHYDVRFWSRLSGGVDLSIVANRDRDRGSPIVERRYDSAIGRLRWRIRRFTLSAEYARVFESQAGSDRTHSRAQVTLRRDF